MQPEAAAPEEHLQVQLVDYTPEEHPQVRPVDYTPEAAKLPTDPVVVRRSPVESNPAGLVQPAEEAIHTPEEQPELLGPAAEDLAFQPARLSAGEPEVLPEEHHNPEQPAAVRRPAERLEAVRRPMERPEAVHRQAGRPGAARIPVPQEEQLAVGHNQEPWELPEAASSAEGHHNPEQPAEHRNQGQPAAFHSPELRAAARNPAEPEHRNQEPGSW